MLTKGYIVRGKAPSPEPPSVITLYNITSGADICINIADMATFTALLHIREENYCFSHFLNVVSCYYAAAFPNWRMTLTRASREKHAIRVQPPSCKASSRHARRSGPAGN